MSIECFIKWAKSARRKGAGSAGLDEAVGGADETGGKRKKGKAGSFVIEDFDAKELFSREWEVPIYGPIRRTSVHTPADEADTTG
ncbi:MAG: hypothetical protein K9L66_13000 [Spirochaetaceae bacterium]|nr:hypothetical protein [Spirochaetaceae bacterium]MCF7952384.1 hypothetical protein [Spirochaetaceae bacterium]